MSKKYYELLCTTDKSLWNHIGCKFEINVNNNVVNALHTSAWQKLEINFKCKRIVLCDDYVSISTCYFDYVFKAVDEKNCKNNNKIYAVCYNPASEHGSKLNLSDNYVKMYNSLYAACKYCAYIADGCAYACVLDTKVEDGEICPDWGKIILEG